MDDSKPWIITWTWRPEGGRREVWAVGSEEAARREVADWKANGVDDVRAFRSSGHWFSDNDAIHGGGEPQSAEQFEAELDTPRPLRLSHSLDPAALGLRECDLDAEAQETLGAALRSGPAACAAWVEGQDRSPAQTALWIDQLGVAS